MRGQDVAYSEPDSSERVDLSTPFGSGILKGHVQWAPALLVRHRFQILQRGHGLN